MIDSSTSLSLSLSPSPKPIKVMIYGFLHRVSPSTAAFSSTTKSVTSTSEGQSLSTFIATLSSCQCWSTKASRAG